MKPDILNPKWPYTNSVDTDIRATFRKYRKEQERLRQSAIDAAKKVTPISIPTAWVKK